MDSSLRSIRALILLYFWLLLWEGALRKWVFPSLSGPLLIARDPVVILIYLLAIGNGIFPWNRVVQVTLVLAVVSFVASIFVFDNLLITLFGLRTNFLHLPLIFVISRVFGHRDVLKMGRWLLILSIPMTLLVAWQFVSPRGAWINAAAGEGIGGQMVAIGERIRPAGIFSFVTGMVSFLGLVAVFLFHGFLNKRELSGWLRFAASVALIVSLILSASRSAVSGVTLVFVALIIICSRRLSRFRHLIVPVIVCCLLFVGLSFLPILKQGITIHQERFEAGGGVQEGIVARYFGTLGEAIATTSRVPLFGYGLGVGTNAGSALLFGRRSFLLGESEWPRVIGESGPIIGYAYILLRIALCWVVIRQSWDALKRGMDLPFLLMASCILDLLSGQFSQPTTLGFSVFSAGLALAATRRSARRLERPVPLSTDPQNQPAVVANAAHRAPSLTNLESGEADIPRRVLGRSVIARALLEDPLLEGKPIETQRDVQLPRAKRIADDESKIPKQRNNRQK
jgi:hypothetical protein